jgi:hypothetical protein
MSGYRVEGCGELVVGDRGRGEQILKQESKEEEEPSRADSSPPRSSAAATAMMVTPQRRQSAQAIKQFISAPL